jgi:uncharacterized membrane protein YdfJ with MMPL/SSD domain
MMFAWWGRRVVSARWWVLTLSAVVVLIGAAWGSGVFGLLSGGGFDDPASESSRAYTRITAELGRQDQDVIVLYTDPHATADQPEFAEPVRAVVARLRQRSEVVTVTSWYDTPAPALVSNDRHETYLAIRLRGASPDAQLSSLKAVTADLTAADPVRTVVGGPIGFLHDANVQIETDVVKAEVLSMPILLLLMILIFRGLVAAATPLLVGIIAILGAFTVTRLLTSVTDISVFAANVITMLGLGMAIDYSLFVVSRFREELAAGHSTAEAVARTIATAGRTVVVSGLTVALALSSLLLFPMDFLKSMGYGGMAAVLVAMVAALTALPALLAVLGPRINALRVPLGRRRSASAMADASEGGWARLARSVMRRPVLYVVGVAVVLVAIAAPFLRVTFGGFDERVLPVGTASRTVAQHIADDFPGGGVTPILALVSGADAAAAHAYADQVAAVPGVTESRITANQGSSSLITIGYTGEATSAHARDIVTRVRALPAPSGARVLVGGRTAAVVDQLRSLSSRLPWMALYVGMTTFLLLFLAFGSVVLPIKAIVMNTVSIGASFGVVVWVFQDGHLAGSLGFTSTGFLEPTNLILMLAVLFGLSTDYEVFLLSRVREEWDRTGHNRDAVANGLQRTGGIITAAALLLIVVIGGFATGGAATIKLLGIGTVVAVAVDAALVRALLVPATMRLLGRWNWWAPGPLARVYRRYGLRESEASAVEEVAARTPSLV